MDVKRQAESWGQLWDYQGTMDADVVITKKMGIKCPAPLSAEQIRIASGKFKPSTVSADKLHPKHISILSMHAKEALARLYTAFELAGNFPEQERKVVTVLIPKSDGGLRPVVCSKPYTEYMPRRDPMRLGRGALPTNPSPILTIVLVGVSAMPRGGTSSSPSFPISIRWR